MRECVRVDLLRLLLQFMETKLMRNASAFQKYYADGSAQLLHSVREDGASEPDLASREHQAAIRRSSIVFKPELGNIAPATSLRMLLNLLVLSSLFQPPK